MAVSQSAASVPASLALSGIAVGLLLAIGGIAFGGFGIGSVAFGIVATGALPFAAWDAPEETMQWFNAGGVGLVHSRRNGSRGRAGRLPEG